MVVFDQNEDEKRRESANVSLLEGSGKIQQPTPTQGNGPPITYNKLAACRRGRSQSKYMKRHRPTRRGAENKQTFLGLKYPLLGMTFIRLRETPERIVVSKEKKINLTPGKGG